MAGDTGRRVVLAGAMTLAVLALAGPATAGTMTFRESNIGTTSLGYDLYEPSVTAVNGALYAAAHSVAAFTTRAPGFVSHDDGRSWQGLPPIASNQVPGGGHVDGDEGIISADQRGRAWQFDNGAGTASLYSYADFGNAETGYNPLAYDETGFASSKCMMGGDDRPWQAYGHDKLILVNNGFVGNSDQNAMQLSVYDTVSGSQTPWNMCAAAGYIPGVPAMRDSDGAFAVPQMQDAKPPKATTRRSRSKKKPPDPGPATKDHPGYELVAVRGNADKGVGDDALSATNVFHVGETNPGSSDPHEFPCADEGGGTNWGFTAYSAAGTLFATAGVDPTHIAVAADNGSGFKKTVFDARGKLWFLWIAGSENGDGALVTWASSAKCDSDNLTANFWAAHVLVNGDGAPRITDVSLVAKDVDDPCGDYHGSSAGPDGRAYVAVSGPDCLRAPGSHPFRVYIQNGGPTLPTLK